LAPMLQRQHGHPAGAAAQIRQRGRHGAGRARRALRAAPAAALGAAPGSRGGGWLLLAAVAVLPLETSGPPLQGTRWRQPVVKGGQRVGGQRYTAPHCSQTYIAHAATRAVDSTADPPPPQSIDGIDANASLRAVAPPHVVLCPQVVRANGPAAAVRVQLRHLKQAMKKGARGRQTKAARTRAPSSQASSTFATQRAPCACSRSPPAAA
jgi:hypothetical protein